MPIPASVVRVVLTGTMPGGEEFSTGFYSDTEVDSQEEAQTYANNVALGVPGLNEVRNVMNTDTAFTGVTVYSYPSGGPTASYVASADVSGAAGLSSVRHPNQVALVVTLLTGAAGRRRRGRMYLPATGASLDGSSELPLATCQNIADDMAAFLAARNPLVVSQVATAKNPVTEVRVDSRMDTQRRRANQQTINGSRSAVVIGP